MYIFLRHAVFSFVNHDKETVVIASNKYTCEHFRSFAVFYVLGSRIVMNLIPVLLISVYLESQQKKFQWQCKETMAFGAPES